MTLHRFCATLLSGALLLCVAACDDPSTVGVGVGPDSLQGGVPVTLDVPASNQRIATDAPPTGNDNILQSNWRMLLGQVNDPLVGTVSATSYFDVEPAALPDNVFDVAPEDVSAELTFTPSYLHGDTTSTLQFALYDVTEEMDVAGAPSDTTFPSEAVPIRSFSFSASDSLVSVTLPDAWVRENLEVLRDTSDDGDAFRDRFHGFRVAPTGGNAVLGVQRSGTSLDLTADTTGGTVTVPYATSKQFTRVERTNAASPPPGRLVAADGLGDGLEFEFDFSSAPLDTLTDAIVNRVSIVAPVDTSAWAENRPEHFVRPRSSLSFRVLATRVDTSGSAPSCIELGMPTLDNRTCIAPLVQGAAPTSVRVNPNVSLEIFRASFLSGPVFSSYRVEVVLGRNPQNTVGTGLPSTLPVVFYAPDAADADPTRVTLTVTPL